MPKSGIEKYLDDLNNLIDVGAFPDTDITDVTHYHKGMTLRQFVAKGYRILADVKKDLI